MLVNIETKKSISEYEFRKKFNHVIFPKKLTNELLSQFNHALLEETPYPEYEKFYFSLSEDDAINENGIWKRQWKLTPIKRTETEIYEYELFKSKQDRAEKVNKITVEVDGMIFDGDETSQERMSRAITAALASNISTDTTTNWVLHDNTVATPTIVQLATALRLAGEEQTRLWTIPYEENK